MNDKITTLICTYRRPKSVRRSILSATQQTHRNIQVSVFDDASGDETAEVVADLIRADERIKYHCHPTNIGALPNFRFAFESVDTPYFSMLSDDDLLVEDFYENAVGVLNNNPKVMFVILNSLCVDYSLNLTRGCTNTHKLTVFDDLNRFDALHSGRVPIDWTAMVFRKEVAQIYLKMDDRHDIAVDMRFLYHAAARYNFACLSKVGALFTTHSESASASRPLMSFVHHGVMISRYIEIINDNEVDLYIRNRAAFYLRKLLAKKVYVHGLKYAFKRLIKNCCGDASCPNEMIENDLASFEAEGFLKTAKFLKFIYKSSLIRKIVYMTFFRYNNSLIKKHSAELRSMQNGEYKNLLDTMKLIG